MTRGTNHAWVVSLQASGDGRADRLRDVLKASGGDRKTRGGSLTHPNTACETPAGSADRSRSFPAKLETRFECKRLLCTLIRRHE